jgi:hypothetical protein
MMRDKIMKENQYDLQEMNTLIQVMKKTAQTLHVQAASFPAVQKNITRILASITMLEINISDIIDLNSKK